MTTIDPDLVILARLEAIAAVQFLLAEREEAVDHIVDGSDELRLLACQAIYLARDLLVDLAPADRRDAILLELLNSTIDGAGR